MSKSIFIELNLEQANLVKRLLEHRELELKTKAAYVAYSSAYNNSAKRNEERDAQKAGAAEMTKILEQFIKEMS